jgi:hypothetical protein
MHLEPIMEEEKASGLAIAALVCGILGCTWVCGGCFTQIAAIVLGKIELNKIEAGESTEAGRTFAKTGMILGIVGVIFTFLASLAYGAFFAMNMMT